MGNGALTVSKILPPPEEGEKQMPVSVKLPVAMLDELDAIAKKSGHSRHGVMVHFLKWALAEYKKEAKK